jgi:hypothetical protein
MNAAAGALITDARQALRRPVNEAAERDLLVAAFVRWLDLPELNVPTLATVAAHAATIKGASRSYREVAILGFAMTDPSLLTRHAADFRGLLDWLMGRPLVMGGDPTPMMSDAVAVLGISLGGRACLATTSLAKFEAWLQRVHNESSRVLDGSWPGPLAACLAGRTGVLEWVPAGLTTKLREHTPNKPDLTKIISQAVTGAGDVTSASEAALRLAALRWASERALEVNLASIAVHDIALVLERTGSVFTRWVWEEKARNKGKEARRWHVENEYHFQSLLFTVLKPWLPELEEEQYLASTGPLQPRADLCLMSLALLIEVKFWYRRDSVSRLIEEVAADVTLYLKSKAPYSSLIVTIWDDGARTEEHEALRRGLSDLNGVRGVVIVNRPSWMP